LATFCWTKLLLCNDAFYTGILFYSESTLQYELQEDSAQNSKHVVQFPCNSPDDVLYCLDAQLSKASSVRTMRTFRPDLPLCREASNCSSLHPAGGLSNMSGHLSVFDQLWDFFPKHKYGKTAATVQTMCVPVRTRSFIRQVVH